MKRAYAKRLALAQARRPDLFPAGKVCHAEIQHDDWCGFNKKQECNCVPFVFIKSAGVKYRVTKKGNLRIEGKAK